MKKEQGAMRKEDSEEEKSRELHLLVILDKVEKISPKRRTNSKETDKWEENYLINPEDQLSEW